MMLERNRERGILGILAVEEVMAVDGGPLAVRWRRKPWWMGLVGGVWAKRVVWAEWLDGLVRRGSWAETCLGQKGGEWAKTCGLGCWALDL